MADIQSNIKVNIDTSNALASIKLLQSQISAFQTQMAKSGSANAIAASNMQQNLLNNINATGKFSASLQTIRTSTESFTNSLEKNKFSLGQYFKYSIASTKSFSNVFKTEMQTIEKVAIERVKTLQTQYIKLGRDANGAMKSIAVRPLVLDLENLSTKTQIAAQKQQLLNQLLKQGSTNLLNFGKNTQWAGRQLMVGFTIPMTMAAGTAVKAYSEIEKASVQFKRVYGDLNTTAKEANNMVTQVQKLAASYTQYGVAVADTMSMAADAAAMGKTGGALLAQIDNATKLSVLGGVDQKTALQTTISLTNAFGISAEQLTQKMNFLNAVENQTVLSIEDMTTAIPKAAPVVKQLGGSVEDLAYFLTAMKEGGINASEGANALKSGLASIINPTKKASDFLSTFGINVKNIVNNDKGNLKKTIIDFATSLDTLDPLNRAKAIEMMFGKFQFARMSTLFANITKTGTQAQKVMELANQTPIQLAATTNRELDKIKSSPMYQFQKAIADLKLAIAPVGESVLKAINPILQFVTKIIKGFSGLSDNFKNFIVIGSAIGGILAPALLMFIGLIANGAANILKFFTLIKSFFNKTTTASQVLGEQTNYLTEEQLKAEAVAASLNQIHTKLIQTFTSEADAVSLYVAELQKAVQVQNQMNGYAVASAVRKYANGGIISGPGTGTSDSILAMVSNGEAIIPAKSVAKNPQLVNQLVSGNIPGFSQGYVYNRNEGTVETHLQDGHKLSGPKTPLIEGLLSSRPQMANLSQSIKEKVIVLGQLVADLPRSLNENLKRATGVGMIEFEKAWNGTDSKLFKAVSSGMQQMGMAFDPSNPEMAAELQAVESKILANVKLLASKNRNIVNDAILSEATQTALSSLSGNVSNALNLRSNTLREYRTTYSKQELVSAIKAGELQLQTARTGGGRIVDPITGAQLGRLRSTGDMSKQEQMAKYTSLSGENQAAFLSQMGLRSDSKFVRVSKTFFQKFIDDLKLGLTESLKIASPSKAAREIGIFTGEGFLQGAKEASKNSKSVGMLAGTTYADYLDKKSLRIVRSGLAGFDRLVATPLDASFKKVSISAQLAERSMNRAAVATEQEAAVTAVSSGSKISLSGMRSSLKAGGTKLGGMVDSLGTGKLMGLTMAAGTASAALSTLPGPLGQIGSALSGATGLVSMLPMMGIELAPIIGGLAEFLPEILAVSAAIGAGILIYNAVNDAKKKELEQINLTTNAYKNANGAMSDLAQLSGITPTTSALATAQTSARIGVSGKSASDVNLLLESSQFKDPQSSISKMIGNIKGMSDGAATQFLASYANKLKGAGFDEKTINSMLRAIEIKARKTNLNLQFASVDISTTKGKNLLAQQTSSDVKGAGNNYNTYKTKVASAQKTVDLNTEDHQNKLQILGSYQANAINVGINAGKNSPAYKAALTEAQNYSNNTVMPSYIQLLSSKSILKNTINDPRFAKMRAGVKSGSANLLQNLDSINMQRGSGTINLKTFKASLSAISSELTKAVKGSKEYYASNQILKKSFEGFPKSIQTAASKIDDLDVKFKLLEISSANGTLGQQLANNFNKAKPGTEEYNKALQAILDKFTALGLTSASIKDYTPDPNNLNGGGAGATKTDLLAQQKEIIAQNKVAGDLLKKNYGSGFIQMLSGADAITRKYYGTIKNGIYILNAHGKALLAAFNKQTIGTFIAQTRQSIADLKLQHNIYTKLINSGMSAADAVKAVGDQSLIAALKASKNAKEFKKIIDLWKQLQKETAIADTSQTPAEKANAVRSAYITQYQDAISSLQPQEDAINKTYNDRITALDEISTLNQQITDSQKSQLDLVDALSKGDIAAAAKTAADIRAKAVTDSIENQKTVLSKARDAQLQALTVTINRETLTIKELTDRIATLEAKNAITSSQIIDPAAIKTAIDNNGGNNDSGYKDPKIGNMDSQQNSNVDLQKTIAQLTSSGSSSLTDDQKTAINIPLISSIIKNPTSQGLVVNGIKYFANGGLAMGSDTIPAMLTPGEFVMTKSAVDRIGKTNLNGINSGADLSSPVYNSYSVTVNAATNANPNDIARVVINQIQQIGAQQLRGSRI